MSDLREADWSDVESEFLVGGCFDGDVLDWEHFEIVGVNLEHASSPRAVLVLKEKKEFHSLKISVAPRGESVDFLTRLSKGSEFWNGL